MYMLAHSLRLDFSSIRSVIWISSRAQIFLVVLAAFLSVVGPGQISAQEAEDESVVEDPSTPSPPCSTVEAHQLDFWLGTWNLTWKDGGVGTNTVTSDYSGCVIREDFSDAAGSFLGMSVSVYNPGMKLWQQTWVDNYGSYLDFTGGLQDGGNFRLSRSVATPKGVLSQRMTFYNIESDSLDWDWETSLDEGETWDLKWQIHYERN